MRSEYLHQSEYVPDDSDQDERENPRGDADLMSIQELRKRIGISLTVVYALAARDQLPIPTIRVGRQFRFSRHAFEELLNRQQDPHVRNQLSIFKGTGSPGATLE